MPHSAIDTAIVLTLLFSLTVLFGLILLASYRGINKTFKLKGIPFCKLGIHKRRIIENFTIKKKYYCVHCGKPRKHPKLEVIEGGQSIMFKKGFK